MIETKQKMQGIIFDLDGVIVHTDHYHYLAWKALADKLNIPFDETTNNRLRGVSRMDSLEIILEKSDKQYTDAEKTIFADEKNELYCSFLLKMTPDDLDQDVFDTLSILKRRGYKVAIGSSSKNAKTILKQLGILTFFDAIADGNDITHSKPHPEVFQKAAQFFDLPPKKCYVIEDAVAGIEAGHAAGCVTISIGSAAEEGSGDYRITSFRELLEIL